ncbi:Spy/CpxP family protein refolding chaperone [Pleionea sediminis]|uniref:Spy/CpxP family protein refolding chaperone n=1 Tax=Pleionea sediminis TaxID=2569479 RepID=UPI0013DE1B4C|nr:Spy/CpxP family protein refolding chaperone [Pleionea sediminis]
MKKLSILVFCIGLPLKAMSISELNADFADEEFAQFFSNTFEASLAKAKQNLDVFSRHLELSPSQRESWQRFEITFLEQLEDREIRRNKLAAFKRQNKSLNSIETLNLREEHLQTRLHETRQLMLVVDNLYQQLNSMQKAKFDRTMNHLWLKRSFSTHHRN